MESVVAKNKEWASPSSPESVEAELYANVREYIANAREKAYAAANSAVGEAYYHVVSGKLTWTLCRMLIIVEDAAA